MKFSASIQTLDGKGVSGLRGLTFGFYRDQTGGAPLWIETQSVAVDGRGAFTVLLGATLSQGIPSYTFASGEPRWIGITVALRLDNGFASLGVGAPLLR
jgi:hypothetical protein